jgi:hypothetical protein
MRVIVQSDTTEIMAIELLEPFLETGTLAVRLDAVSRVLDAIRDAAFALTPKDSALLEANPTRMSVLAQTIYGVADAARALAAAAAPNDPYAVAVNAALDQLHLAAPDPAAPTPDPVPAWKLGDPDRRIAHGLRRATAGAGPGGVERRVGAADRRVAQL